MTAGRFDIPPPILKGAKWEHLLEFEDDNNEPLDLTSMSPFTGRVGLPSKRSTLLTFTLTNTSLAGGQLTATITAAQSALFPIGPVVFTVTDVEDNCIIRDTLQVEYIPD